MPAIVAPGDRLVLPSGRTSSLKRGSMPFSVLGAQGARMTDGRNLSFRQIAVEQPWVAIAVTGMARQISRLPLKVYKRKGDDSRERDRDSRYARALARPGRKRSAANLKYAIACGLLVDGNHVERYFTRAGRPGLEALDWRWLIPHVWDNEVLVWQYCPPDSGEEWLDPDEVIHYRWEGIKPGPLGTSPLESLGVTVRSEDSAQRYAEANFKNGARPGIGVIMDPAAELNTQGEREAYRRELDARYKGEDNAGGTMLLGGGVTDVKSLDTQTPVEAELIEVRKINREEILGVYDWLRPDQNGTQAGSEVLEGLVFKQVLPPWTNVMAEETTTQFINPARPGDHYAEFDFAEVLRGDPKERMAAYSLAIRLGVLTINDARQLENLPRFDIREADEPLVQANNLMPLAQAVEAANAKLNQLNQAKDEPKKDPEPDQ